MTWQRQSNHFYGKLGLPQDPKAFLEPVIKHLDEGLERLREAVARGEVRVDDTVHLDALNGEPDNSAVAALRRALFASRPDGQLPEIILQVSLNVPNKAPSATDHRIDGSVYGQRGHTGLTTLFGGDCLEVAAFVPNDHFSCAWPICA